MRCEEARAELLAGTLGDQANEHLESCPRCRAERSGLDAIAAGLDDELLWAEPPAELADEVVAIIGRHGAESVRRRWLRRILPATTVAAMALAAVAGWALLRGPSPDWEVTMQGVAPGIPDAIVLGWSTATGTRVVIDASGVGAAAPGHAYELWFSSGPVHVSAGTFTSLAEPVQLTVGVARRDYPRLWVTLEPIDEDPTPSPVVLFDMDD